MSGKHDFSIVQGATFSKVITWKDENETAINVTGYSAKMQIRDRAGTLLLELSTANSRISLGGSAGTITITGASSLTDDLPEGTHFYDLKLTSGGSVDTVILRGSFQVLKRVTA